MVTPDLTAIISLYILCNDNKAALLLPLKFMYCIVIGVCVCFRERVIQLSN